MKDERYFKKERNFKKHLKWIIPTILTIVAVILMLIIPQNMSMETITQIRIISRYFAVAIVAVGVTTIFYSFSGIFKCKTWVRCLITALMLSACIYFYIDSKRPPDIIRMKEDQLYILPKSPLDEK